MKTMFLIAPASLALLSACASSGPESQLGRQEKSSGQIAMTRTSDCVFHSTVSGFEALDDLHVVLFTGGQRKAYLAEISRGCFNIEMQSGLAAVDGDNNGQICGVARDSIAYRRLNSVYECRILALEELSDERRIELGIGAAPSKRKQEEKKQEENAPQEDEKGGETY